MSNFQYDPAAKEKILSAALEVRANERPWDEALMVAKTNGYKGGLPGLKRLIRISEMTGRNSKPAAKRKPGRPRKTDVKRAPAAAPVDGLEGVQAAINGIVKNRIAGVIAKIRAMLDAAEAELR